MRALIIESSSARLALRDGLADQGYAVDVAMNAEDGLWLANEHPYDVIVIDLVDRLAMLGSLREHGSRAAILLLTEDDDVEARVRGLDMGADDCLVKPFAFAEFHARVRTLVRRRYDTRAPALQIDDLVIDTVKREVKRRETAIALSPREYALLEYLALRTGELVTRTDIWEHVYDFNSDARSNVVDVYVSYLRKKLGQPILIHTRRGLGYILTDEHPSPVKPTSV